MKKKVIFAIALFQLLPAMSFAQGQADLQDRCMLNQYKNAVAIIEKDFGRNQSDTKRMIVLGRIFADGDFSTVEDLKYFDGLKSYRICSGDTKVGKSQDKTGDHDFWFPLRKDVLEANLGNPNKAKYYFELARKSGDFEGSVGLAQMEMQGKGVPKNLSTALNYALEAATNNIPSGQYIAGQLYAGYDGSSWLGDLKMPGGLQPNYILSYMWFNIAVANGLADARSWRDGLQKVMSGKEIEAAQNFSSLCVKSNYRNCADGSIKDKVRGILN